MFRTDLLSIIRSLDTVFTETGIYHTEILKMGKITSVYIVYIYMYVHCRLVVKHVAFSGIFSLF